MCGICGYFNGNKPALLDVMLESMIHRGPDEQGRHVEQNLALGIRRLSVIDPEGGHQPVFNETKTVCVVQNGEIYNFRELRNELIRKGHVFATRSDTEVIVHLYEEEGSGMVKRLRGMFAVALWDSTNRRFYLFRDRLGIKPLYHTTHNGMLFFASELTALRAALPSLSICSQSIARYLTLLYIPAPDTIYENVQQLLPGHFLEYNASGMNTERYFSLSETIANRGKSEISDIAETFRELLRESVEMHLVSDVPLGLFLSGGLDSGAILAMMRSLTAGPIKTFSIGYKSDADSSFNETSAARMMAEHFQTDHTEELLSPDAAGLLPEIVEKMDEPFANASSIPTYLVSRIARNHVTVALSGAGGDELFGGYPRYLGIQAAGMYATLPMVIRKFCADSVAPLIPEKGGHCDNMARLKRFLKTGTLPLQEQYLRWITFLDPAWTKTALARELSDTAQIYPVFESLRAVFQDSVFFDPADKAMAMDIRTYLPDDLLRMSDRMSMAHSLELRVPFCDHRLLEFALGIPAKTRFGRFRLKNFMRKSLKTILPDEIINAPKRGFMTPLARWLREDLKEMIGDILSETAIRQRGYINPEYTQWLINEHQSGKRNFSDQIYSILVLELWLNEQNL